MEEMVICGICLNMDVKMYELQGSPLEDYYMWIVGNALETIILHYFKYACYECAYYIRKCNSFKEKCLRGQSVLNEVLQEKGQLTKNYIQSVDRKKFDLCSNLTYSLQYNLKCLEYGMITAESTEIKQIPRIKIVENDVLKEVNDTKIKHDFKEEEKYEITTESSDDNHSIIIPTEKKDITNKLRPKKKSEKNVIHSLCKKQRQEEGSVKYSVDETGRKLPTLNSKQDPKQKSQALMTTLDDSLAKHFELITFTLQEQSEQLMKRKELPNYKNSQYKCSTCYKGYMDPDAFDNHMKRHDPANGSKVCPICKLCYLTKRVLTCHLARHEKNYICKTCSRICKSLPQAKTHAKEHEGKTYKCEQCDYVTTKSSSLLTHVRLKHPSDFVCDICGFSFVSELGLKHHKSRHRFDALTEKSSGTRKGYCKACNLHCNSNQGWKLHIETLSHKIKTNKDLICEECNEMFKNSNDFKLHQLTVHHRRKTVPKVWPSKCPHCDKIIASVGKYYFHISRWHPDQPYPITRDYICDICGKQFMTNALLQYHIRKHVDFKKLPFSRKKTFNYNSSFKCTECSRSFSSQNNLNIHKTSHSDARPYSCDFCHKAFKTKNNLIRHIKTHMGEKQVPSKKRRRARPKEPDH